MNNYYKSIIIMVENEKETQSQIKEVMSKVEKIKNQNQKLVKLLIWNDLA